MKRLQVILLALVLPLVLVYLLAEPVTVGAAPGPALCSPLPSGYGLMPWVGNAGDWVDYAWITNVQTNTEKNVFTADLDIGQNGHSGIAVTDWLSPSLYPGRVGYLIVVEIGSDADATKYEVKTSDIAPLDFQFDMEPTGAYSVAAGRLGSESAISSYVDLWNESNHSVQTFPHLGGVDITWYWAGPGDIEVPLRVELWVIVDSPQACPSAADLPFGPSCTITTTQTIKTGPLVTETEQITITYPVSTNLVANYSFESGALTPLSWVPVRNGSQLTAVPPFWSNDVNKSRSFYRSVYDGGVFELDQLLALHASGTFLTGFYARCDTADCTGDDVSLLWGDHLIETTSGLDGTYRSFSDTYDVGYGSGWLRLQFIDGSSDVYVDDVFAYPVDANGDLLCTADYYPPPAVDPGLLDDCVIDPFTGACMVVPTGSGGSTCHYCGRPSSADALMISYWIAWLGCVMRNLFVCNLRVWLLVVGNWTAGVVSVLLAYLAWSPGVIQGGADWLAGTVVPALITALRGLGGSGGSNLWDLLIAIVELIASMLATFGDLMLGMMALFSDLITAVRDGFAVAPAVFEYEGLTEPSTPALSASGPNPSKAMYLVLLGLAAIDNVAFGEPAVIALLGVVIAGLSLMVLLWTLRYWRRFVTF